MDDSEIIKLQVSTFFHAAKEINLRKKYPLQISLGYLNQESEQDLRELREKNLLSWDTSLKGNPYTTGSTNPEHMIKCVVYYGNAESGHCCVGYCLGSYNSQNSCLELDFIEKRCDGFLDLKGEFLPIIINALTLYANVLTDIKGLEVNQFALVGPLPGVIEYYKKHGFEVIDKYRGEQMAMVRYK